MLETRHLISFVFQFIAVFVNVVTFHLTFNCSGVKESAAFHICEPVYLDEYGNIADISMR